jgi:hypothetical protein
MILSAITGKTVIENGVVGQELTICLTPVWFSILFPL